MGKLTEELANASRENPAMAPLDLESLSEIVESELDNIAGGGYSQCSWTHEKTTGAISADMDC
jgi:hypothetical protein